MPSNQFSKQPQQLSSAFGNYLNGGAGDTVVGGVITGVPAAINANQGIQDTPGDRLVLGMADALALSNTAVGTLYGGVYQYVTVKSTATLAPVRGKACFWDTASPDNSYVVTTDENGTQGVNLWAGVFIQALGKGNSGWIQVAGKASVLFTTPLTGAGAGSAAFIAGDGAGRFDTFGGVGTAPTFDDVQNMFARYAGVCETGPVAATVSVVDMDMRHFRW